MICISAWSNYNFGGDLLAGPGIVGTNLYGLTPAGDFIDVIAGVWAVDECAPACFGCPLARLMHGINEFTKDYHPIAPVPFADV
jgi:hypothetical protein